MGDIVILFMRSGEGNTMVGNREKTACPRHHRLAKHTIKWALTNWVILYQGAGGNSEVEKGMIFPLIMDTIGIVFHNASKKNPAEAGWNR
jgi:hypothetical protein